MNNFIELKNLSKNYTTTKKLSVLNNVNYKFKKGKKVLVPAITFSATAAAVLYCNLIPVFVDINQNDLVLKASANV